MSGSNTYRLVTRSDFDGLVCGVLLRHLGLIDAVVFVHPKDMQDGRITITPRDISTNVPYVDGVHIAFDHHMSENLRVGRRENHVINPDAASAARVVFDHYGGAARFPAAWADMMAAVDQADSARYTLADILDPGGWTLLNYVTDSRTGLGRFRDFRISNHQLMMDLITYCGVHSIDDILSHPDVRERIDLYVAQQERFKQQIRRCARVHRNLVVLDLRGEETIFAGNRFMIYALFPDANMSIHVLWGPDRHNTVFAIGKSILTPTARINIGELCLRHGGGGHANAGTCQVDNARAESKLSELIDAVIIAG